MEVKNACFANDVNEQKLMEKQEFRLRGWL